jgi:hypothetical protein
MATALFGLIGFAVLPRREHHHACLRAAVVISYIVAIRRIAQNAGSFRLRRGAN